MAQVICNSQSPVFITQTERVKTQTEHVKKDTEIVTSSHKILLQCVICQSIIKPPMNACPYCQWD